MDHEKSLLHLLFMSIATILIFWIVRDTIPVWVMAPALLVILTTPWLQRHKLTWESVIGVALLCIVATNNSRLAMGYAARYREFFFLLVSLLFYTGVVYTRLKPAGTPVYLGNVVWLAIFATLDVAGAGVSIAMLSLLVLLGLLLAGTREDRPRFLQRIMPVAVLLILVTLLAVSLPTETGPFSASAARGLQDFLFGHPTAGSPAARRYTTSWWKLWPAAANNHIGSWLMRTAFFEEVRTLVLPFSLALLVVAAAWFFLGAVLQQGPRKSLQRLIPSLILLVLASSILVALTSMESKALNVLMFGPASPWRENGTLFLPTTWQMFLALRSEVRYFPADAIIAWQIIARNLAVLTIIFSGYICVRQAFATDWNHLEAIGRRRDRIQIERTIKRIKSLDDNELLRDPRGTVIAIFYMGANALYPLDLAMVRGETPTELTARVTEWYPDIARPVDVLGRLFYKARYSTDEISPEQVMLAKTTYQKLLELLQQETRNPRIKTKGAQPVS